MKTILLLAVLVAVPVVSASCTQQERAREFGGTATVRLAKGRKLVSVSWKGDNDLWYLTRPMRADEQPETFEYTESNEWGFKQGTVVLVESR